jgi:hypothetical protein
MRTLRMAFVGGFAGALMAGNVATLHAAPLPTNVASMKSSRQFDPGPVGGWRAAAGISVRRVLKEGSTAPWRPRTNISSRSEGFRYLRTGCLPGKPLDG